MNEAMYLHPKTQANIARLRALGVEFVEPEKGYLACGDEGWGRLAEPEAIVKEGLRLIARTASLEGKTVLVTAGPTREHLDPVRFLSNPSSGKMGYELAREAVARGAKTILVSGPTSLVPPAGARTEMVRDRGRDAGGLPARPSPRRTSWSWPPPSPISGSRTSAAQGREGRGRSRPGRREDPGHPGPPRRKKKPGQLLVGFAAETHDILAHARKKMAAKKADLMVANAVGDGRAFGTDDERRPHHRPLRACPGERPSEQAGIEPRHFRPHRGSA